MVRSHWRKLLGFANDGELTRRMAAAGYREPVYVELFYTVKLLGPVVAGLIAGFLLHGPNVFLWFIRHGGGWLSRPRFLVVPGGEAARRENSVGASRCCLICSSFAWRLVWAWIRR